MNPKTSFRSLLERSLCIFLIGFCLFIGLVSFADALKGNNVTLPAFLAGLLLTGLFFGSLYGLCRCLKPEKLRLLVRILSLVWLLACLFEASQMQLDPSVDLKHIIRQSLDMLDQHTQIFTSPEYFGFYTNNIPLGMIIYWLFYFASRLLGPSFHHALVGGVFNVFMIWIGLLSFNRIVDEIIPDPLAAAFVKLFSMFNPLWFVYASYYYTDTIMFPFMMTALLFFIKGIRSCGKKKWLRLTIACILIWFAFKIKVTALILVIALVMTALYKKKWKDCLKLLLLFFLTVLVCSFLYGKLYEKQVPFDTHDTAVPITHFMMMGSHDHGWHNKEDVAYTQSLPTHEEKLRGTTERIFENLKKNGLKGNVLLILRKEAIWGTGTRGYLRFIKKVEEKTPLYQVLAGSWSWITQGILQAYNFYLFVLIGFGLLLSLKKISSHQLVLVVYWGGTILFTLLWEAHARHVMGYIPFLIPLMAPLLEKDLPFPKSHEKAAAKPKSNQT